MHSTPFATSPDGIQIAYDVTGTGPSIVLLHGEGMTRQRWYDGGYVERLIQDFQVITMDIRGNGESDKPTNPADYTTDKLCDDILAVTEACQVEHFTLWGFSKGGNIGRYLASQSARVAKVIIIGVPFGSGASGDFRQFILSFREHWTPIMQAQLEGTLDLQVLSKEDRDQLQRGDIPIRLATMTAVLDWASIKPGDLLCPALWLIGSRNEAAMASLREYEEALQQSKVRVHVAEGLDHAQEFTEIERVLPTMLAFTQA